MIVGLSEGCYLPNSKLLSYHNPCVHSSQIMRLVAVIILHPMSMHKLFVKGAHEVCACISHRSCDVHVLMLLAGFGFWQNRMDMLLPSEVSAWNYSYLSRNGQRNVCRALVTSLKTRLAR